MLDPAFLRDRVSDVESRLRSRGLDVSKEMAALVELEQERRALIPLVESLKRDQNTAGEEVAKAKREGRDPAELFAASKARAAQIRDREATLQQIEERRRASRTGPD